MREIRRHLPAGTPVEDPQVRDLSMRRQAMTAGLQSGDAQIDGASARRGRRCGVPSDPRQESDMRCPETPLDGGSPVGLK
ncbi:hypothetical protein [Nonomuraea sp. NPDC049695]|uniref:hypothetical protein n=1 Tax=Nonomuraea sp. NPDC049695 TaxID=3154734 RepID=UPI003430D191